MEAGTIRSAPHADAQVPPTNESSRWERRVGAHSNQVAAALGKLWRPARERVSAGCGGKFVELALDQDGRGRPSLRGLGRIPGSDPGSALGWLMLAPLIGHITGPVTGPAETPAVRAAPEDIPTRSPLQKPTAARLEPAIGNCGHAPTVAGECLPAPGARLKRSQAEQIGHGNFECPSAPELPGSADRDLRSTTLPGED